MSKYRILTIGFQNSINGISTSAMNLYRHMDRDLIQWDFLLRKKYKGIKTTGEKGDFIEEINDLGGNIYWMNYGTDTIPKYERKRFKEILTSDDSIMGVHVHDLGTNTYPLCLADRMGKPVKVIQYHSAYEKSKTKIVLENVQRDKKIRLKMISGDQFDRLACSELSGIAAYRGYDFQIFPNAVDVEKFSFNPLYRTAVRSSMGIDEDAFVMGFVGLMYFIKRPLFVLETFLEILKRKENAYLVMLGSGPQHLECAEFVKKHRKLKGRVFFPGYQKSTDMFYSAMDLLMCPSQREGFPNVLAEAQANGVMCIVSDEVTDEVCITPLAKMFPHDKKASAWADEILKMKKNAPVRRSYDKEIKAAGFDIRDAAKRLTDLYLSRIEG